MYISNHRHASRENALKSIEFDSSTTGLLQLNVKILKLV